MADYSWEQANEQGRREAQLGYPNATPQQQDEPWSIYTTRQNSFDWTRKQQDNH